LAHGGAFLGGLTLLFWSALPVQAQGYPQMHVVALAQHADRAVVDPGGTFHVTIHVKITQRRDRLDELILGSFENCEIISNETVRTSLPDGTDFIERLTLQALRPGEATISPAYIDALDPAQGRPMRFSSNALHVRVSGASPVETTLRSAGEVARRLLTPAAGESRTDRTLGGGRGSGPTAGRRCGPVVPRCACRTLSRRALCRGTGRGTSRAVRARRRQPGSDARRRAARAR
jgi:hypothetical protein